MRNKAFTPFTLRAALLTAGLVWISPPQAHAAASPAASPFVDLVAIDREVAEFTGKAIGQSGGAMMPVDRRLRLNACMSPLALSWRTTRRDAVLVQCPDPGSWRVFVPVRMAENAPSAVARGEAVTIAVVGEGFAVSQPGEALDAGAVGDWIRVRTLRSGAASYSQTDAVRARITRPGEVEVELRE
ncbi:MULTISPECIES: flagella basal body P-ring formation protein FlgA [unclassified Novosphingobium]|uniref:flagella basal body P-ring formation protein FlgA n=1 Tax=unclassified Novosphingobium TaxID=2644732 RepID=UPI000AE67085|nr:MULTISPECIES: flagella basal body P-ring formation protein FlgA [unclassified Novosphingobium]MBN9143237.1 flagella basal body P-ring formation protein FlgA [Novosphingobium sp.]MDR6706325.1 flagella basal body P-ring formation protein FlgA [Novosphingobium sp. 1748]